MKNSIFCLFNLLLSLGMFGQIPTTEILTNTYFIKTDTMVGTCFTVEVDDKEYLVTAKHLFKKEVKNGTIVPFYLNKNGVLEPFRGQIFYSDNPIVDVAVIKVPIKLSNLSHYPNEGEHAIGQDCYFLGFPYKEALSTETKFGNIALVKKGIVSAFYKNLNLQLLLLDGHNNPGFSGGPVISYDYLKKKNFIAGVVSAYYAQINEGKIKSGTSDIPFNYSENSGIIICYPSRYYLEIIKKIK